MKQCTKPNCECVAIAERKNGGNPVKNYPCLADVIESFDCGSMAYKDGNALSDNPHGIGAQQEAWEDGFRDAAYANKDYEAVFY